MQHFQATLKLGYKPQSGPKVLLYLPQILMIIGRKKLPQIDIVREVFKRIELSGLENLTSSIVKKAKENKIFEEGTIDAYTVAAIDGIKLLGSNIKSCNAIVNRLIIALITRSHLLYM